MGVLSSVAVCWKVASVIVQSLVNWGGQWGGVLCVVLLMGGLAWGWGGGGRRGADMRSRQCMKALSMGPVSNCPAVPSCHFHFALSGPESGNFDTGKGCKG